MKIELIPSLAVQRDLYSRPLQPERFKWYLEQLLGEDGGDIALPIVYVNPMGKAHCLEAVQRLLDLDAEGIALAAVRDSEAGLAAFDGEARVCLNLIDDAGGGWTNRFTTEAGLRFGSQRSRRANRSRRFVIVGLWTSEEYTAEAIRAETLAALHRFIRQAAHGPAATLGEQIEAEGQALRFAGVPPAGLPPLAPALTPDELRRAEAIISRHESATDLPTQTACWFGDAAAVSLGYAPLGLPEGAGFAVALARTQSTVPS